MSLNCYVCIELNAHSLVKCILQLKKINKPHLFTPHLFESQACESLFRQVRSLSTTYSTVTNCIVKEILERIRKIQSQNDIVTRIGQLYVYPRVGCKDDSHVVFDLPSSEEIKTEIEKAKIDALRDAIAIGLVKKTEAKNVDLACKINPHTPKRRKKKISTIDQFQSRFNKFKHELDKVALKNFSDQFGDEEIPETSPFIEIYSDEYGQKRIIVKKT